MNWRDILLASSAVITTICTFIGLTSAEDSDQKEIYWTQSLIKNIVSYAIVVIPVAYFVRYYEKKPELLGGTYLKKKV